MACKKCGKTLFGAKEKDSGYCDHCRTFNSECSKCGKTLFGAKEKDSGYCDHCRTFS